MLSRALTYKTLNRYFKFVVLLNETIISIVDIVLDREATAEAAPSISKLAKGKYAALTP